MFSQDKLFLVDSLWYRTLNNYLLMSHKHTFLSLTNLLSGTAGDIYSVYYTECNTFIKLIYSFVRKHVISVCSI